MIPFQTGTLGACLDGLALLGCVQAAAGAIMVARFGNPAGMRAVAGAVDCPLPAVSILKPLHGDEPLLEQALRGFVVQDYPRFQIVFGVQDQADPAIAVVERLRRAFPDRDLRLVVDPSAHGANRKVANLINMLPHAAHEVLVISDSDIHVAPDYLRQVIGCLSSTAQVGNAQVGLVTTLYCGIPASRSLASRLGAAQINHSFMPGVLLSRLLGRQDCLGSTMALRRDLLEAVGGFEALSDDVADDHVLGRLVREGGRTIEIAPTLTATTVAETGAGALFAHELRWGRTVRAVEPLGYALSSVQFPLFWASLALAAAPHAAWSWLLFAAVWALRGIASASIERRIGALAFRSAMPFLLLPLRDWASAIVMAASFSGNRVSWRGQILRVGQPLKLSLRYASYPKLSYPRLSRKVTDLS